MANIEITNVDLGSVAVEGDEYRDELLTLAGADSIAAGTILARDSATLKLVLFVKGGVTAGNGIPKAVLTYPVTSTGAGDVRVRALTKGVVKKERLIIDADGTGANVDAAVLDQLRAYGITPIDVQQISVLDNQP